MSKAEELFHQIASSLNDVQERKMFGALCIKAPNGKAGVMFKDDNMIFKLPAEKEAEALQLNGAKIFEPMGGRPMTGWVQLDNRHASIWSSYAALAMENVSMIVVDKKKVK